MGSAPYGLVFRSVPPSRPRGLSFVTKSRRRSSGGLRCCCLWYTIRAAICQYIFLRIYNFFRISAESAQDQPQGAPDQSKEKEISVCEKKSKKELKRDYIYIYNRADNARMICGRNRSRPPPLDVLGRIRAPCHPLPGPDQIRRNAHPLRGSDQLPRRTNRARISSPRSPPNRPPAAPIRPRYARRRGSIFAKIPITPPEAVKKSGSKNPRHVTIVSMACHYCYGMSLLRRSGATRGM